MGPERPDLRSGERSAPQAPQAPQAPRAARASGAMLLMVLTLLGACAGEGTDAERASSEADALAATPLPATISASSPNFEAGAELPERFSCDGTEINPALEWSGVPADAASVVLLMDDPGATDGTYVHWVVTGIAPTATAVAEDAVPEGAVLARNSGGDATYGGACPPEGEGPHTYRFTVYALGEGLPGLDDPPDLSDTLTAVAERAVAKGELTATLAR